MDAPRLSAANAARLDRLSGWYLPGRFGLFFHWGPFTGGGSAADDSLEPLAFPTPEALEAAAPEPPLKLQRIAQKEFVARSSSAIQTGFASANVSTGCGAAVDTTPRRRTLPLAFFPASTSASVNEASRISCAPVRSWS